MRLTIELESSRRFAAEHATSNSNCLPRSESLRSQPTKHGLKHGKDSSRRNLQSSHLFTPRIWLRSGAGVSGPTVSAARGNREEKQTQENMLNTIQGQYPYVTPIAWSGDTTLAYRVALAPDSTHIVAATDSATALRIAKDQETRRLARQREVASLRVLAFN
jgi:hypothetical protein